MKTIQLPSTMRLIDLPGLIQYVHNVGLVYTIMCNPYKVELI